MWKRRTAFVAVAGFFVLVFGTSVSAAPQVTVTPATGLADGATVMVAWSGLTPGQPVNVFQCMTPPSTSSCAVNQGKLSLPDPTGLGSTPLVVHKDVCPGPAACVIVANEAGSTDLARNAVATITFAGAPPPSPSPPAPPSPPAATSMPFTGSSFPLGFAGLALLLVGVVMVTSTRRWRTIAAVTPEAAPTSPLTAMGAARIVCAAVIVARRRRT
jgi:hypothetical protein